MFMKIGDKIVPIDRYEMIDGKRVPIIQATSTEKRYPDGRIDCTIHVPILKLEPKITN